jgi:hypothetical protein
VGAPYSTGRVATLYLNNWLKVRETQHMGAATSSGTAYRESARVLCKAGNMLHRVGRRLFEA